MDNKLVICIVIFALTLLSYIINKIPMWVTALLSLAALYITGCVDANGALGGFANVNTILMGACFMVASGFRRTSLVKIMCDWLLKLTNGSFMKVYFGYLLLGVLLTNFMGSPMVVYAIIGPLNSPAFWIEVGRGSAKQQATTITINGKMYLERLFPVLSQSAQSNGPIIA